MINIKDNGLFKKCLVLVMALALIATTVFTQFVSAEETGKWVEVAPMNTARHNFRVATVNGKIYVMGGCDGNRKVLSSVEEYDPATNKWTNKSPMKRARESFVAKVVDGKIYVMAYGDKIEEYDPTTDEWTIKNTFPRGGFQAEELGGKIYAIGGSSSKDRGYLVDEYDTVNNKVTSKSSMPTPRYNITTTIFDGKIYAIGGFNGVGSTDQGMKNVEVYDPINNTWSIKASMISDKYDPRVEVIDGKIYAIGGNGFVEEYNPVLDKWVAKTSSRQVMHWDTSEVIDGKIYFIGASTCSGVMQEYNPQIDAWEQKASLNTSRHAHQSEIVNGKIYAIGGIDKENKTTASVEVYDPNGNTNTNPDPTPNPTLTVTPSADKVKVGKEFTTAIGIHNVKNIFAEDIKITYDTERFEYLGATPKTGIKICKEDTNTATPGTIRFIVASLGKGNGATGDKDLLDLKFRAKKAGQGKVDIIKGRIADNATLEIDVADANCGEAIITVEANVDVNRNGETTLLDLGIDAGYYNMKATDTDATKHDADVVANGMIDDDDLTAITGDMLLNKNYTPNNA